MITRGHLEEGGALRVGGALLEKQPQLDGLWCGEQDEVELLLPYLVAALGAVPFSPEPPPRPDSALHELFRRA